jgi:CBS domain-containing protein
MTSLIVAADHDTSVVEAARLMAAEDIGSLIVTKSDVLAGMVTRREIVGAQLLSDEAYHALVLSDVMTTPVITIGPEADLGQVIALMNQTGERHVPVVEGEAIIGIITATDVIRVLATMKGIADGATLLVSDSEED